LEDFWLQQKKKFRNMFSNLKSLLLSLMFPLVGVEQFWRLKYGGVSRAQRRIDARLYCRFLLIGQSWGPHNKKLVELYRKLVY
jgi:hypothetical protein